MKNVKYEFVEAFRNLLDNYESETGKAEEVTHEEENENRHFLDVIMETGVMKVNSRNLTMRFGHNYVFYYRHILLNFLCFLQKAHDFLVGKGMSPEDPTDFKRQLYKIWFRVYRRLREDE